MGLQITTLLLDIDGVVNHKGILLPDISKLLQHVIDQGVTVKFVTNCSLHKLHGFDKKILPGVQLEIIDPVDVLHSFILTNPFFYQANSAVIGTREIRDRIAKLGINMLENGDSGVQVAFIFEKLHYEQDEILQVSRSVLRKCFLKGRVRWENDQIHPNLPDRSEVYRMVTTHGLLSDKSFRTTAQVGDVANPECHFVRGAYWLPMANVADQSATLADRVWLLLALETSGIVGTHQ